MNLEQKTFHIIHTFYKIPNLLFKTKSLKLFERLSNLITEEASKLERSNLIEEVQYYHENYKINRTLSQKEIDKLAELLLIIKKKWLGN